MVQRSTIHCLKTWPEYFTEVLAGRKTFEIRKNDRGFKVGDYLRLQEFDPLAGKFTGPDCDFVVTYMTEFAQQSGYVVMGIKRRYSATTPLAPNRTQSP